MAAHTKVNGFCKTLCQDLYVASLFFAGGQNIDVGLPTFLDARIFGHPPWENSSFFNMELLPTKKSRAWIFKHGCPPTAYTRMSSYYRWEIKRYYRFEANGHSFMVKKLSLRYEENEFDQGADGVNLYDQRARKCRGWSLHVYANRGDEIHCLVYKRRIDCVTFVKRVRGDRKEYNDEEKYKRKRLLIAQNYSLAAGAASSSGPETGLPHGAVGTATGTITAQGSSSAPEESPEQLAVETSLKAQRGSLSWVEGMLSLRALQELSALQEELFIRDICFETSPKRLHNNISEALQGFLSEQRPCVTRAEITIL